MGFFFRLTLFGQDFVGEVTVGIFRINRLFFDIHQRQLVITPAAQAGLQRDYILIPHLLQGMRCQRGAIAGTAGQ